MLMLAWLEWSIVDAIGYPRVELFLEFAVAYGYFACAILEACCACKFDVDMLMIPYL